MTRRGVDETALLTATVTVHTKIVTGMVDLARPGRGGPARLIDVVPGWPGAVVPDWLTWRAADSCAGVEIVALDPFRGYDNAFRVGLPAAAVVLDPFYDDLLVMPMWCGREAVTCADTSAESA
ncbi:MAG: transposase [Pseudorhodobacter sp.]|nr:transposase [Frankiaceae bacterium]